MYCGSGTGRSVSGAPSAGCARGAIQCVHTVLLLGGYCYSGRVLLVARISVAVVVAVCIAVTVAILVVAVVWILSSMHRMYTVVLE